MRFQNKVIMLLAALGLTGALVLWLSHQSASDLVFKLVQEKVLAIAVTTATQIDGDAHERLPPVQEDASEEERKSFENEDYLTVRKPMRESRDANQPRTDQEQDSILPVTFIYTIRPRTDGVPSDTKPYEYVVDAQEDGEEKSYIGEKIEFREGEEIIPKMGEAHVDSMFAVDEFGEWLTAFAPVRNSSGEDVALLGVDIEAKAIIAQKRRYLYWGLIALAFAIVATVAVSIFLSKTVTAPLKALGRQVNLIHEGDLTTRIPIETKDEFNELGEAIHEMADGLKERESFKEALVRFVSAGKTDSVIEEAENDGDSDAARRVTVLAARLQGLEGVTNSLSADKVFAFLSDWYSTMIDIILTHRGSLEKSAGESVTATFGAPLNDPDQERHALEAALTMQQELSGLRRRWEIPEDANLSIGAAIHTGHVTVSDEDEVHVMDVASLQRIIGALSIIQEAAHPQSDRIVISEAAADGLKDSIPLTYLKSIEVPGTGSMLSLHTVQMPTPS